MITWNTGKSHTQKIAPIEAVSTAVRIRRSMIPSVPNSAGGQIVVCWINEKQLTLETGLTSAEEVEERQTGMDVKIESLE